MSITPGVGGFHALTLAAVSVVALATVVAPLAGADDRTCTNTSATTTVCSRPGGSTSINTSPAPLVGPSTSCGYGVGLDYLCGGGVTWNIGGVFSRR